MRMKIASKLGWTLPETWQDSNQKKHLQIQFGAEGIQMLTLLFLM